MSDTHNIAGSQHGSGPSTRCLSALLIDALRVARERGDELEHLRSKYVFVIDVAIAQGETVDKLRRQVSSLREQNAALSGQAKRLAA